MPEAPTYAAPGAAIEAAIAGALEDESAADVPRQVLARVQGRNLCVSVISPRRADQQWLRYSDAAAERSALSGDRLLPVVACGRAEGTFYVAYDARNTQPLSVHLDAKELSTADCLQLLWGVAAGLDQATAEGLYPAEVTPESVFVHRGRGAHLAELGVARAALGNPPASSDPHAAWVAPEVLRGEGAGERAAVYSFGALLFTMLTGVAPHDGRRAKIARSEPPSLHEVRPELPEALQLVVSTAMAREPERRYQTASEARSLAQIVLQGDLHPAMLPPSRGARFRRGQDQAPADPAKPLPDLEQRADAERRKQRDDERAAERERRRTAREERKAEARAKRAEQRRTRIEEATHRVRERGAKAEEARARRAEQRRARVHAATLRAREREAARRAKAEEEARAAQAHEAERRVQAEEAARAALAEEAQRRAEAEEAALAAQAQRAVRDTKRRIQAEEAARQAQAREAQRKAQAEQAARKAQAQEAQRKAQAEEAARKARAQEAERKAQAEQAARKARAQEAQRKARAERAAPAAEAQEAERDVQAEEAARAAQAERTAPEAERKAEAAEAARAAQAQEAQRQVEAEEAARAAQAERAAREAKRKAEAEEAARKRRERDAKRKARAEEAARKRRVRDAKRKARAEEAARKRRERDAKRKARARDAARKRRERDAERKARLHGAMRQVRERDAQRKARAGEAAPAGSAARRLRAGSAELRAWAGQAQRLTQGAAGRAQRVTQNAAGRAQRATRDATTGAQRLTHDAARRAKMRAPRPRRAALPRLSRSVPLALVAGAVAVGALGGVLLGGPSEADPPSPQRLSSAGMTIKLPVGWERSSSVPGTLAAHPAADPSSGLSLEPLDAPVEYEEQATPVRLGRLEAWREQAAEVAGARDAVRYVVPTETGKLVITCRASARAAPNTLALCERAASTLRLRAATGLPLAAVVEQQERWQAEVSRLDEERADARGKLARADRPTGQRLTTEALARVHERAAERFAALPGGEAVATAARNSAAAYAALAGAAGSSGAQRWNAARERVRRTEAALRRALAAS